MQKRNGIVSFCCLLLCTLFLTGCGGEVKLSADMVEENTVLVRADGTMEQMLIENFAKEYYSEQGLKEFAEEQISEYNRSVDEERISLEHMEVENKKACVLLAYKTVEDFNDFNTLDARLTTVADAKKEGLLPDKLEKAQGEESVSLSDAELSDDWHVFFFQGNFDIQVSGDMKYYSNAIFLSKKVVKANDKETAVVIFKK